MATTSPDNIWTPDSGDNYALTTDLAAMADTVQDALSDIRDDSAAFIGTNAQRTALTAPALREGITWYATDTNIRWFYDGANWITNEGGGR